MIAENAKTRGNSHYADPDKRPNHGPYAHCWWDRATERWKFALKPQGKSLVAAFIAKYPNPAAILFRMKKPKCAVVLASRWLTTGDEKSEQAGAAAMFGVVKAAIKFQPSRGFRFETFAPYHIMSEVQRLDMQTNRSREDKLVRADHNTVGFYGDGWDRLNLEDERADAVAAHTARHDVHKLLATLDDRAAAILRTLYLTNGRAQPLHVAASQFGLSKERVRQIRNAAFARLRENAGET